MNTVSRYPLCPDDQDSFGDDSPAIISQQDGIIAQETTGPNKKHLFTRADRLNGKCLPDIPYPD